MNDDFLRISYEDLLRDPNLIDEVMRDARRYRAREVRRVLHGAWQAIAQSRAADRPRLRTAACG